MFEINKINFFCVGAQKAGTTLLHDILNQHSDIYLPENKESHFFDVDELYEQGLNYYYNFFRNYNEEKIIGNINPNLQVDNKSINRIIDNYGSNDIKILFILRDPVKRAYSHYLMSKKRGYEDLDFFNAFKSESKRIKNAYYHKDYYSQELGHFEKNHLGYASRSLYSDKLNFLYQKFPKENIKVVIFEEFVSNKKKIIQEILEFLEVDKNKTLNFSIVSNPAQKARFFYLSKFLNTPSKVKTFLKFLTPRFIRVPIKVFFKKKNMKNLTDKEKNLSENDYILLMEYFKNDIQILKEKFNINTSFWKY